MKEKELNNEVKELRGELNELGQESSPRAIKEQELVDGKMKELVNKLLNVRMQFPENTDMALDKLEKEEWKPFCIKPKSNSPLGIKSWKKIKPKREAFREQAIHFIERFDKAAEEQLNKAPEVKENMNYKFK